MPEACVTVKVNVGLGQSDSEGFLGELIKYGTLNADRVILRDMFPGHHDGHIEVMRSDNDGKAEERRKREEAYRRLKDAVARGLGESSEVSISVAEVGMRPDAWMIGRLLGEESVVVLMKEGSDELVAVKWNSLSEALNEKAD